MAEIFGMELKDDLDERDTPIDAVVVVKYISDGGDISWLATTTETLTDLEALGMLRAAQIVQEEQIKENWRDSDGE